MKCCNPSVHPFSSLINVSATKLVPWKTAVKVAGWIHIDEMRTLLEIHYDDVHFQRWKQKDGKVPDRKGKYQVLKGTINAHRKRLCQRLQLPKEVKDILTMPRDEDDLAKLEKLREAIVKEIEGREYVLLETTAHIESIASSVERCKRTAFVDELGENCRGGITAGSRVVFEAAYRQGKCGGEDSSNGAQ